MSINNYTCIGRLTKDPELRAIPNGTSVCELRLAVDGMGRKNEVGFINAAIYGNGGEAAAKYLTKGWLVALDGRLEYSEWETEDSKRHDYTIVGNVQFLAAPRSAADPVEAPEAA